MASKKQKHKTETVSIGGVGSKCTFWYPKDKDLLKVMPRKSRKAQRELKKVVEGGE